MMDGARRERGTESSAILDGHGSRRRNVQGSDRGHRSWGEVGGDMPGEPGCEETEHAEPGEAPPRPAGAEPLLEVLAQRVVLLLVEDGRNLDGEEHGDPQNPAQRPHGHRVTPWATPTASRMRDATWCATSRRTTATSLVWTLGPGGVSSSSASISTASMAATAAGSMVRDSAMK